MQRLNNKGFTLTELIIVMVIFIIGSAIALPGIMDMGRRDQVKAEARMLKDQLARARATAIEQNSPVAITLTTNNYTVGTNTITLNHTTLNPASILTWDGRGYPDNAMTITVTGTANTSSYTVDVFRAGGISITRP